MYAQAPPAPPPKPLGSHDVSRMSTPASAQLPRPPPLPEAIASELAAVAAEGHTMPTQSIPDPGDQWLPMFLQDKSKQDLADMLSDPALLSALTHAPQTIHPSLRQSHDVLQASLADNMERAAQLLDLEARLVHQRSAAQAQLLATHALERQWRAKQADMDHALAPFAPASLYQRLGQGVLEQEGVCHALEESFLEGEGDGALATEREVGEWVRRYREAKKLYYLRQERKERWDEGRVGGWR
ncbi:Vacuolar protein sorting-associated protein 37C [Madurella mycetomatis]|uniref:Vacuolar protein sorting-associated protein 37C n=1 Tax=Madurella mycetomatis TaxID=100816 RepID=A0A175VWQ2_9PEZI|nr:Vacuolar protein sorting-associated protein 37C [Madurella mycetomatis]KXX79771.1 Vacuolar protein sorting-associated protein 37C [Madurella mycetomatis]